MILLQLVLKLLNFLGNFFVRFSLVCWKEKVQEVYLEPCQTSVMKPFWKNCRQMKAVNIFRKNATWQMFECVLNTPLSSYIQGEFLYKAQN